MSVPTVLAIDKAAVIWPSNYLPSLSGSELPPRGSGGAQCLGAIGCLCTMEASDGVGLAVCVLWVI